MSERASIVVDWVRNQAAAASFNRLRRSSLCWRKRPLIQAARRVSMLHIDTLALLGLLAHGVQGAIVEIGPYLGGSTVAIGSSIGRDRTFISIEKGGRHDHFALPTADIVHDLRRNIADNGITDKVSLIVGHSRDDSVRDLLTARLRDQKIGLFFVDSDGMVGDDFEFYSDLMRDDCILVFDDYEISEGNNPKLSMVKNWILFAEARGLVTSLGITPWATWFGVRGNKLSHLARLWPIAWGWRRP